MGYWVLLLINRTKLHNASSITHQIIGCRVALNTSSCVENAVKTLSKVKVDRACLEPWPLMTVTVFSWVDPLMTGRVECFFSSSFIGRSLTTTCIDDSFAVMSIPNNICDCVTGLVFTQMRFWCSAQMAKNNGFQLIASASSKTSCLLFGDSLYWYLIRN